MGPTGDFREFYERLIEVAGLTDLSGLDQSTIQRSRPLADLAIELSMVAATRPDLIRELRIDHEWITVRRGSGDLDDGFRLDAVWRDHFGYLA